MSVPALCGCGCGVPAAKCQCSGHCRNVVEPVCRVADCWTPCVPYETGKPQALEVGTERLCLAHAGGWLNHLFGLRAPWLDRYPRFMAWLKAAS